MSGLFRGGLLVRIESELFALITSNESPEFDTSGQADLFDFREIESAFTRFVLADITLRFAKAISQFSLRKFAFFAYFPQ